MPQKKGDVLYERSGSGEEQYWRFTGKRWRQCRATGPKWMADLIKAIKEIN